MRACFLLIATWGCASSPTPDADHITTVVLTFSAQDGSTVTGAFHDPDRDGGAAPIVDAITLSPVPYVMHVEFLNADAYPDNNLTPSIKASSSDYQVFFDGSVVSDVPPPIQWSYLDADGNGLPVGLETSMMARVGMGDLLVTLRHFPSNNPMHQKSANLDQEVKEGGLESIPGFTDASVRFSIAIR